jgi:hypothetical protein
VEEQYFMMAPEVQGWMGKMKQIACDMDDLLDGFGDYNSTGSQSILKVRYSNPKRLAKLPILLHIVYLLEQFTESSVTSFYPKMQLRS